MEKFFLPVESWREKKESQVRSFSCKGPDIAVVVVVIVVVVNPLPHPSYLSSLFPSCLLLLSSLFLHLLLYYLFPSFFPTFLLCLFSAIVGILTSFVSHLVRLRKPDGSPQYFQRVSIVYDSFLYALTIANAKICVVKKPHQSNFASADPPVHVHDPSAAVVE